MTVWATRADQVDLRGPNPHDLARSRFLERTACWAVTNRVTLTEAQIYAWDLPIGEGKDKDPRAKKWAARNGGKNIQVEVDAVDPPMLRALIQHEIDQVWDVSAFDRALAREARERSVVRSILEPITAYDIGGEA